MFGPFPRLFVLCGFLYLTIECYWQQVGSRWMSQCLSSTMTDHPIAKKCALFLETSIGNLAYNMKSPLNSLYLTGKEVEYKIVLLLNHTIQTSLFKPNSTIWLLYRSMQYTSEMNWAVAVPCLSNRYLWLHGCILTSSRCKYSYHLNGTVIIVSATLGYPMHESSRFLWN